MKKLFTIAILALSINAFAQLPSYVPTNGLIGWWPFTGNANDLSGNNNNGTVNGATLTTDRFGNTNSAYSYNGTNNNISVTPASISAFGLSSFSASVWFKTTTNTPGNFVRYDNCLTGAGWGLRIGYDNTNTASPGIIQGIEFPQTRVYNSVASTQMYNNNTWHCAIYIRDVSLLKDFLYIDGNLISQFAFSNINNITVTSNPFLFGSCGSYEYFNGIIDDIGLWNRVLTQQEITNLYNAGICYQTITVTDTLIINANLTGINPVIYANTIKIFPNPTNDHITVNYGNYSTLTGYTLKITNALGQIVFTTPISQQQSYIDLSTWSGNGIYFVYLIDAQSNTIEIRKIVLQ